MRTEDWPRVEELFHTVSQLGVAERDSYLARECGADTALRREVESLVAASESNRSFMERPLVSAGLRALYGAPPGSLAGTSLGHYKILRVLGEGGWGGEVYLAEDCWLERPVALKFISNHYAGDGWAREQMMKEARAVARLEHPHICQVYGAEEIGGHNFIVMQYVEGETLASLMRREPLGPVRAAALAEQIAGALAFAHARGVIHRDVKPQNIMVTPEGQAKVLDFGLAKFVRPKVGAGAEDGDPGQTLQLGGVVGTPAYMSPEQARGEELDFRSDIFSFGVVLYEMLAGRNPFLRETVEETVSAVHSEGAPPLPGALGEIALQCLAKERALRPESAELIARRLGRLHAPGAAARPRESRVRRYAGPAAAAAAALLLLLSSLAGYAYLRLSKVHTLAVLPITNQSNDRQADYLGEGLTRTLSDKFSYLPRLRLRVPSPAPPAPGGREDLARIGRELKAEAVLSGRIVKQGDSLQLRLGLLDVADASQVWEGSFDLNASNLLALQEDVTRQVASGLGLWLVGGEHGLLTRRQTDSEEALAHYMRGRHHLSLKRDRENVQKAIALFERAVDIDPTFARAHTGLAEAHTLAANVLYGPVQTRDAMEKARYSARQALALDDSLAEAHTAMGIVRLRFDWDWIEAEREFKRAIELDPEYAQAHFWYTALLAVRGRFDEAVRESEIARELDPYSPLAQVNYGRALYYARRFDEAEAYFRLRLAEQPEYGQFLHMLGFVLLQQGRTDEAVATLEKLYSLNPIHAAAALGHAYGRAGRSEDALRMIGKLDDISNSGRFVPPFEKALVYVGMGRRDEAFALLEEAYRMRFPNLTNLTAEPIYDGVRADPRFSDLVRRVNLAP